MSESQQGPAIPESLASIAHELHVLATAVNGVQARLLLDPSVQRAADLASDLREGNRQLGEALVKAGECEDRLRDQLRDQLAHAAELLKQTRGQLAERIKQSQTLERDTMNRLEPNIDLLRWENDVLAGQRDLVLRAVQRHRRAFRRHHPKPCGLEAHIYRIYCQDTADLDEEELDGSGD